MDIVHTYAYDNASRVTSFNTTGTGAATRGYGYDDAGQLTSKTGGTPESYTYDDNGNRTAVLSQTIVTGPANRLRDDGTYVYEYDKDSNVYIRALKTNIFQWTEYLWDHRNRLAGILEKSYGTVVKQILYTYDAEGRRVKRVFDPDGSGATGSASEYFVYSANPSPFGRGQGEGDLSLRFGNAQELTHRYLYGPAVDQVLVDEVFVAGTGGQRVSDEVLWQLADHQGTIRDIVDDNGILRKYVKYDSFGQITQQAFAGKNGAFLLFPDGHPEAVDQLFYFQGREWDQDAKLQNNRARWYDPAIGRQLVTAISRSPPPLWRPRWSRLDVNHSPPVFAFPVA